MAGGFVGIDESAGAMRLLLLDAFARERFVHGVKGLGSRDILATEIVVATLHQPMDEIIKRGEETFRQIPASIRAGEIPLRQRRPLEIENRRFANSIEDERRAERHGQGLRGPDDMRLAASDALDFFVEPLLARALVDVLAAVAALEDDAEQRAVPKLPFWADRFELLPFARIGFGRAELPEAFEQKPQRKKECRGPKRRRNPKRHGKPSKPGLEGTDEPGDELRRGRQ